MVRIGNYCVVDSTPEEESCGSASLLVAVTPSGCISTTKKVGGGAFQVINNLQGLGNAILTNNSKRKCPHNPLPLFLPFLSTSLSFTSKNKFCANSTPTKYLIFGNFQIELSD